jgi:hypothetical protein
MNWKLLLSNNTSSVVLSTIILCLIQIPLLGLGEAATFPEQNCISNGGNGGSAGNGGIAGNGGSDEVNSDQFKDIDSPPSASADTLTKRTDYRDIQNSRSSTINASESAESVLMKNDLPESVEGNGGNGGNGGKAVAMCILIAPVINIDSNIPFEPNALLDRPNLSYTPYLRME